MEQARDARQVDVLRRYYVDMQGRRRRPIGVFVLVLSVLALPSFAEWCPNPGIVVPAVGLLALFAAVRWYRVAGERYDEEFGCLAEGSMRGWPQIAVWACVCAPLAFAIGSGLADPALEAKLLGAAAFCWIAIYGLRTGKMWPHSVALFALLASACLLTVEGPAFRTIAAVELAAIGLVVMVGGEIEHRKLEGMLGPRREEG